VNDARAGTPREIVGRLRAEILRVLAQPEVGQRLEAIGMPPAGMGPEALGVHVRSEHRKWSALVRDARIRID
jgi:tripartite-type tricarboxylate transporter receptor subunit TctC